jgi:hypothetical protein
MAWAMAHKGKTTSNVSYNPEDQHKEYTNTSVHIRISEYTSAARIVHGPEYDPSTEDLDAEVIIIKGGTRQEAWVAMAWRQHHRLVFCSLSLPDLSTKHELKPDHTPITEQFTALGRRTLERIRNIIGVRPRCFHVATALVSGNPCSLVLIV